MHFYGKSGKTSYFSYDFLHFCRFYLVVVWCFTYSPRRAIREAKDQVWGLRGAIREGAIREGGYTRSFTVVNWKHCTIPCIAVAALVFGIAVVVLLVVLVDVDVEMGTGTAHALTLYEYLGKDNETQQSRRNLLKILEHLTWKML